MEHHEALLNHNKSQQGNNRNKVPPFDNTDFYRLLPSNEYMRQLGTIGLSNNEDLKILFSFLHDCTQYKNILDIGAGYGRAIYFLITLFQMHRITHKVNYTAVDNVSKHIQHIQNLKLQTHSNIFKINAIKKNALNYLNQATPTEDKKDLILCMWSVISEFKPQHLLMLFEGIANTLNTKGKFIVDNFYKNSPSISHKKGQHIKFKHQNNTCYNGFAYNQKQLIHIANTTGLKCDLAFPYKTSTGCSRILYIFSLESPVHSVNYFQSSTHQSRLTQNNMPPGLFKFSPQSL